MSAAQNDRVLVASERFNWLAPMVLWRLGEPIVDRKVVRIQGGGAQRSDAERSFAAVLFVLLSGAPWREVPRIFYVSWQTAHRRFLEWSRTGLWSALEQAARSPDGTEEMRYWAEEVAAAANVRLREAAYRHRLVYHKPIARRVSMAAEGCAWQPGENVLRQQLSKGIVDRIFPKKRPDSPGHLQSR